uniref:Secreted protein n=1 Tax=Anopheles darlingi TaxID=43151 RepID=A0A2M4D384_ANODA
MLMKSRMMMQRMMMLLVLLLLLLLVMVTTEARRNHRATIAPALVTSANTASENGNRWRRGPLPAGWTQPVLLAEYVAIGCCILVFAFARYQRERLVEGASSTGATDADATDATDAAATAAMDSPSFFAWLSH